MAVTVFNNTTQGYPIEISTEEEMDAVRINANKGIAYLYTGPDVERYRYGWIYRVTDLD